MQFKVTARTEMETQPAGYTGCFSSNQRAHGNIGGTGKPGRAGVIVGEQEGGC